MKTLTIRRHAQRTKPGQNLSQQGINLAKRIKIEAKDFHIVATANIPRAIQTAIIFGHEVTMLDDALGHLPREIFDLCPWPNSFDQISSAVSCHKSVAIFAQNQADLWMKIASQIPESGHALIISHGAIIELGILACLPKNQHTNLGSAIGYCEGIRLEISDNHTASKILRVAPNDFQVEN